MKEVGITDITEEELGECMPEYTEEEMKEIRRKNEEREKKYAELDKKTVDWFKDIGYRLRELEIDY